MIRNYIPVLVIAACWGCDSISDRGSSEFNLVGGAYSTDSEAFVPAGVRDCFFRHDPAIAHRLDAGWFSFLPDNEFALTFVGQQYPYETTSPETLHVEGGYEQYGSLLRLSPYGEPIWFATLGPDYSSPSTLVLADYSPARTKEILGLGHCRQLVFTAPNEAPNRSVSGGTDVAAFDLVRFYHGSGSYGLPRTFGRLGNNRYNSARVELRSDGSYQFTLWHLAGNTYVKDDTLRMVSTSEGTYVKEGPLYAFDPGTARMAMAVSKGDSLILYHNDWKLSLGRGNDLLLLRR